MALRWPPQLQAFMRRDGASDAARLIKTADPRTNDVFSIPTPNSTVRPPPGARS